MGRTYRRRNTRQPESLIPKPSHGEFSQWPRRGHMESLSVVDIHRPEFFQCLSVFHRLGNGLQSHCLSQALNCLDDCLVDAVIPNFFNEPAVYFEIVDAQGFEIAKR